MGMAVGNVSNNYQSRTDSIYGKIASGKRIQSAKDDAAGLAISQLMKRTQNGLDVGASNIRDGVSAMNVKDGALQGITDSLQRVRDLSLQSMNGLYGADEKNAIQGEIDSLLENIDSIAKGTEFNTLKVLDGSMATIDIAMNPDGTGSTIQMESATLDTLGLTGYNVTGNFDLGAIDQALNMVNEARSGAGAATNRLESGYSYNTGASLEQTSARSRIEDLDIPSAVSEKKKNALLMDYQLMMQKKKSEQEGLVTRIF